MNFTSKTILTVFFAVAVLSLLLLASPEPRTTSAQQPDYTAQCSNGVIIVDPQDNRDSVQECEPLGPLFITPLKAHTPSADQVTSLSTSAATNGVTSVNLMLELINEARTAAGVNPVELGDNIAAKLHAESALANCFSSHWGIDGLKPYMRYSLAGGRQSNAENVAGLDYCVTESDGYAAVNIERQVRLTMNGFLLSPGHRANILNKWHKRVNLGLASDRFNFKTVQHFDYDYVEYDELPNIKNGILSFSGTAKNGVQFDEERDLLVSIFYDPPPHALTLGQVSRTYCYRSGVRIASLRRPLPIGWTWPTDEYTVSYKPCPDPYDVPANAPAATSVQEARDLWQEAYDAYINAEEITTVVPWITASDWQVADESFSVTVELNDLLDKHDEGVYTILVWGKINGEYGIISSYSIFYGVAPPDTYSVTPSPEPTPTATPPEPTATPTASDKEALTAFYNTTSGAGWTDNTNWLNDAVPLSSWHGVQTDADGRVTALSLPGNNLTGSLPAELGSMTNLERLHLDNNQLSGTIPSELGNLSSVRTMYLQGNQLTGALPQTFTQLASLEVFAFDNGDGGLCAPTGEAFQNWLQAISNQGIAAGVEPLGPNCTPAPTPAPSPTPEPTATPTPEPAATALPPNETPEPTATAEPTPVTPEVPQEVLNRISMLETLVATLRSLMSTLESKITALGSRVAALEANASAPTPMPTPMPTPIPTTAPGSPTPTPTAAPGSPTPSPSSDPCRIARPSDVSLPVTLHSSWNFEGSCVINHFLHGQSLYKYDTFIATNPNGTSWQARLRTPISGLKGGLFIREYNPQTDEWVSVGDSISPSLYGLSWIKWTPVTGRTYFVRAVSEGLTVSSFTLTYDFAITGNPQSAPSQMTSSDIAPSQLQSLYKTIEGRRIEGGNEVDVE